MRPWKGGPAEFGGAVMAFRLMPSNKKNEVGPGKLPPSPAGPATQSTCPLGKRQAGASLASSRCPLLSAGKSGPDAQTPTPPGVAGGVYRAVCPVAPITHTRPSGSRIAGPISLELACTSTTGGVPALTQLASDGT